MLFVETFPLLTACILFRFGIINVWCCAGVATISPSLHALSEAFLGHSKVSRPLIAWLLTSTVVYFVAVVFLLLMPNIFIIYYCILFVVVTYLTMVLAMIGFDQVLAGRSHADRGESETGG